jgi:FolB domain-containing protein
MRKCSGGCLCVSGLEVACTIGVTERERSTKQAIVLNLELEVDFTDVSVSDDLEDTVDYRSVSRRVVAVAEASSFQLVETLATHLVRTILTDYPRVGRVRIEAWKPGALRGARSVGAIVISERDDGSGGRPAEVSSTASSVGRLFGGNCS